MGAIINGFPAHYEQLSEVIRQYWFVLHQLALNTQVPSSDSHYDVNGDLKTTLRVQPGSPILNCQL